MSGPTMTANYLLWSACFLCQTLAQLCNVLHDRYRHQGQYRRLNGESCGILH